MQQLVYLSKFLAQNANLSRRAATQAILDGRVKVNDNTTKVPSTIVNPDDIIKLDSISIRKPIQSSLAYILLNKPDGVITSTKDQDNRTTVIDLLPANLRNKIVPVGRLDCLTQGALLLTNDGDLAYRLTHPKFLVQKTYEATLDRSANSADLLTIRKGFFLEDGFIKADYVRFDNKHFGKRVEISIHSGKNRIVRRIFKHLGYNVIRLKRVSFAGLQCKGMILGSWRKLSPAEIKSLKFSVKPKDITKKPGCAAKKT